ncbi:MAG: dethiobiotin synthase [Bacillota bacterium]
MSGIFIIGTDTDIGKTFVTTGIYKYLNNKGINVFPYKPIESGAILKKDQYISSDMNFLCKINNIKYNKKMNTYCFKTPVSPHLACEIEKRKINIEKIKTDFKYLKNNYDFILCEGAGGLHVPLIRNKYYIYDLIRDFNLDSILVTSTYVGTLNHTLLTINELKRLNINLKGIVINKYNDKYFEKDNVRIIKNNCNVPIVLVKENKDIDKAFENTNFDKIFKGEIDGFN